MSTHTGICVVPTERRYVERTVWYIAGVVILATIALASWVHPLAVLLVVATAFRLHRLRPHRLVPDRQRPHGALEPRAPA